MIYFVLLVIQSEGCSMASAAASTSGCSGNLAFSSNTFNDSQKIPQQSIKALSDGAESELLIILGVVLVGLLVVLIALLVRINVQRSQVANDLRKRFEERTLDLLHSKKQLTLSNLASDALSSSVSRKLTAIAATLNGIQHLESVDRTEISTHLAALVDDIREVTRMLDKEHESPT